MHNYGIDVKELTSENTKILLENYRLKNYMPINEWRTKIELIRKHRELFGSDLKTAKESIEEMFY